MSSIQTLIELLMMCHDGDDHTITNQTPNVRSYKDWQPAGLPSPAIHRLVQRRIYCQGEGLQEPKKMARIRVEILIFGIKLTGIIDSGSNRSFLSESAYERVKNFQIDELKHDCSSATGVRLGDKSIVKTLGGTCFVIDVGDVYGPQWLSVMPGLSNDVILGMDFWLSFKVSVDPMTKTWSLAGSKYSHPLSQRHLNSTQLCTLSVDQTQRLKQFLDAEFSKFDNECTGETDLITHKIELTDPTPHS